MAVTALPTPWAWPVAGAGAVVALAWTVAHYTESPATDWRSAAHAVAAARRDGETVVVPGARSRAAIAAYEPDLPIVERGRGSAVWVIVEGPASEATDRARLVVRTPRYALLAQARHGDELVVQRWVRP